MPKLNVLNWKVIILIISPITKKAQNASKSVTRCESRYSRCDRRWFLRGVSPLTCKTSPLLSTTLSSIGISIWLRMTRLRKQNRIGQLQLCETFANSVMVFNDHFFSDDTARREGHDRKLLPLRKLGRVGHGRRGSYQRYFHRPFVARHHRLDLPESRYVEYVQCSSRFVDKYPVHEIFAVGPGHQFRADAIGV